MESAEARPSPCEHKLDEGCASELEYLFERIGLTSSGSARLADSDFPDDGDASASYRNATFVTRPFNWGGDPEEDESGNPVQSELDVNFEHFASGTRIAFYKHVGRSTTCSRRITRTEMRAIVDECVASLGPGHRKGVPRPDAVGVIEDVRHVTSRSGKGFRIVKIGGLEYAYFDSFSLHEPQKGERAAIYVRPGSPLPAISAFADPEDLDEAVAAHAEPPPDYERASELDTRSAKGDGYDSDAWRERRTGRIKRVYPGRGPDNRPPPGASR